MNEKEIQDRIAKLSLQYWEALENMDWAGADLLLLTIFYDSCLERMGAKPLKKNWK